jgi:hypothetical protein
MRGPDCSEYMDGHLRVNGSRRRRAATFDGVPDDLDHIVSGRKQIACRIAAGEPGA